MAWIHSKMQCHVMNYMGLDERKPVFGDLQTSKVQTSLRICAVWSVPLLFAFWKSIISWLATSEISIFKLVSVAEQAGLNLTLSETLKAGFLTSRPTWFDISKLILVPSLKLTKYNSIDGMATSRDENHDRFCHSLDLTIPGCTAHTETFSESFLSRLSNW